MTGEVGRRMMALEVKRQSGFLSPQTLVLVACDSSRSKTLGEDNETNRATVGQESSAAAAAKTMVGITLCWSLCRMCTAGLVLY